MTEIHKHFWHFLVLTGILLLGSLFILYFRSDPLMVTWGACGMSLLYVVWGILHHQSEGTLHPKIATEYILIATLGSLILLSIVR